MRADEIFATLDPSQAVGLLGALREADREVYRVAMAALAARRRLRTVFLERKPLPERHAWMAAELTRKSNADLAIEVLQGWLLACHRPMLRSFLDGLGVTHDGDGMVENLPPEPPRERLDAAIDNLLERHAAWEVRAYLNLFCQMDIADWPTLREIVGSRFAATATP